MPENGGTEARKLHMFTNAVRFWGEVSPVFKGTVVEKQAAEVPAQPR